MKKLLYYFLMLVVLSFSACTPNRMALFPNQLKDSDSSDTSWNALLIAPSEFPELTLRKPIHITPYIYHFQKTNPGFVDLAHFKKNLPNHPLSELKRWYSAYFFKKNHYLNYMVLEFTTTNQAQEYLTRLRSEKKDAALKILRYQHYVITIQVRSNTNEMQTKEEAKELFLWANNKQSKIMSEL